MVPAAHHQAPYRLGEGLTVAGWSPDGEVTEALEVNGHRFGVGVHWHPEESDDLRLFAALVEAAAEPRTAPTARPEPQPPRKPVAIKPKAARPPVDRQTGRAGAARLQRRDVAGRTSDAAAR